MLNLSVKIGRLVRDPELRHTSNGTPVCNFTIACDRNYTNKNGEQETDFFKVVTWRKLAENVNEHLGKGRLVAVQGSTQINETENNGKQYRNIEIHADEVKFLDYPDDNNQSSNNSGSNQQSKDNYEDDFDVPF